MKNSNQIIGTITDRNGVKTPIREKTQYAVIYFTVDTSAYQNYEHDEYLGHDDCEGTPHGPRFLFDKNDGDVTWNAVGKDRIMAVIPYKSLDEVKEKVKQIFG